MIGTALTRARFRRRALPGVRPWEDVRRNAAGHCRPGRCKPNFAFDRRRHAGAGRSPVAPRQVFRLPPLATAPDATGVDPWALAGLGGLRALSLRDNGLGDLAALSGLTRLEVLDIGNNRIADLGPLAALPWPGLEGASAGQSTW